jgi:hypothetical protein
MRLMRIMKWQEPTAVRPWFFMGVEVVYTVIAGT